MSDRVAVFDRGRVVQVGTPAEIYERPATAFVAGFVGTSTLLTGAVARDLLGADGSYVVRPEKIRVGTPGPGDATAEGTLVELVYAGAETRLHVQLDAGVRMIAAHPNAGGPEPDGPRPGDRVRLVWSREQVVRIGTAPRAGEPVGGRREVGA